MCLFIIYDGFQQNWMVISLLRMHVLFSTRLPLLVLLHCDAQQVPITLPVYSNILCKRVNTDSDYTADMCLNGFFALLDKSEIKRKPRVATLYSESFYIRVGAEQDAGVIPNSTSLPL